MKLYKLKKEYNGYKKGTPFYLVAESEFIGVKEFVLKTQDLTGKLILNEKDFLKNFVFIKNM